MPEFSACYFCGTALDAQLSEYPVVPGALHPPADQQRTVVLCPTCRRKLGAVVETILAAVEDAPDDASIQSSLGEGSTAGAPVEQDDGGFEFPDEASTRDEATTSNEASTSDEAADEEADAATAEDDLMDEESDEDGPADEPTTADEDDETTVSEASDGADDEAGSPASADETSVSAEEASTTEDEPVKPDTESSKSDVDSSESDAESSESDAGPPEDEPQLTALEYNRVMRLLQNREFPVDHEEFKVVATNAYEIGDDEFDTIIEAAAERDLIGLEGGQIVES